MCESCTACCIHEYAGQQRLRTWLLMLQEMDILDMPVTESDIDSTAARDDGAVAATATSGESHSATAMEPSNCYRCLMPNYMGSHADECEAPLQKFLVCPKCQCICATLAVFDRHTRVCLGLTVKRAAVCAPHRTLREPPTARTMRALRCVQAAQGRAFRRTSLRLPPVLAGAER